MHHVTRFRWWRVVLLGGVTCAGVVVGMQHTQSATPAKSSEPRIDTTLIEKKLAQIVETQQTILKKLDAMTEELRIIKVRATQ